MTLDDGVLVIGPGEGRTFQLGPDRRMDFKVLGEQTGGAFSFADGPAGAGFQPPAHIHATQEEAFYIIDGLVDFIVAEKTVRAEPGTFVIVRRGTMHSFKVVGPSAARMLTMFSPAGEEEKQFEALEQNADRIDWSSGEWFKRTP